MSAKTKTLYVCSNCGEESITWQGKCPVCNEWNTFKEFKISSGTERGAKRSDVRDALTLQPLNVADHSDTQERISTGMVEFDRVLGGGIVRGSVILLGGEPGIGKSTLLLQSAQLLSKKAQVVYFSGEESTAQVAGRAKRLGLTPTFSFANETRVPIIRATLESARPDIVIIDSIQTLYDDAFPSTPGSLVQVRESTLELQKIAKALGISIILVGHITKEGTVAGPKTLEHMVDVVMYLEGESRSELRLLRSMKNRFGATYEVGIFELSDQGMKDIIDPTKLFIEQHATKVPGTALTVVMEGARPMLVEIQALVVPTAFGYPKRTSSGVDPQRLHIFLAILERRVHATFSSSDVFLNVVGGYRIQDRGSDLSICMALLSALSDVAIPAKHVFCGEVGLTGEVRSVYQQKRRMDEMQRLGYEPIMVQSLQALAAEYGIVKARKGPRHAD